jgi:hypothetical protein
MSEAEWFACENPHHALDLLRASGSRSRRKDRLAAAAALRHFWTNLSTEQQRAVIAAEPYADGEIRFPELRAAAVHVGSGMAGTLQWAVARVTHRQALDALVNATHLFVRVIVDGATYTNPPFPDARAYAELGRPMLAIFRCIFGNPFRKAAFSNAWGSGTAVALARRMHESRNFDAMLILADALEEAGCTDAEILAHCRSEGPHVRGCWVVDLILGKQ